MFNSFDTGLSPKVSSNQYEPVPLEQPSVQPKTQEDLDFEEHVLGLQHKIRVDKIKAMLNGASKARAKDVIKWYNYTKIATIAEDVMMNQ